MWCIIKQKYNAINATFVTATHMISMIVTSLVQTVANPGLRTGTYDVTDRSCLCNWSLFVSIALSRATVSHGRRKQLGNGNFTDECYQIALREFI